MTALISQTTVKYESFLNEENNQEDSKHEKIKESKCGEVLLLINSEFLFVCVYCHKRFDNILIFQTHIKDSHIRDKDPLHLPHNKDIVVIKSFNKDVSKNCANLAHKGYLRNSFISRVNKFEETEIYNSGILDSNLTLYDSNSEIAAKPNEAQKCNDQNMLREDIHSDNSEQINENGDSEYDIKVKCTIKKDDLLPVPTRNSKKRNRKKKVYSCSFCQHIGRNKNSLEAHMLSHHGTGTRYQCEECGKCFRNASNLKSHLVIHSGTRPYKCDFCNSGFSHPNSLRTHRYIHTGERPHKCKQCDKGFVSSSGLKIHMREHTGETPFVCQYCERGYANKCHYNRHIISHSNRKAFECKMCDKAFKHRETFNKHMLCHTSEKKLVCDVCQKRFIHKKNLAQHKKIHSRVKQYICKVCNKDFAQNAGLYSHMKYHKNKE